MPWMENGEHNNRLLTALNELAAERGALERLAGAINADARAAAMDAARRGENHQDRRDIIAASTLTRWRQEGLARIANAQPHKKRIVFEFLESADTFRTSIYNPAPGLPDGLAEFIIAQRDSLSQLRFQRLSNLDGTYRLYRRSWAMPDRRDQVLISRLTIETVAGLTRYCEEQDYTIEARGDMPVQEHDEGVVFNSGTNVIMLGFGNDASRIKLFAIHAWHPTIDGKQPVYELKGSLMGVSGTGPHSSTPFVAFRADGAEIETGIVSADSVDPEIRGWIGPD